MGRVSRHKRIKTHDPFCRRRTNRQGDNERPCLEDEQQLSKPLKRLIIAKEDSSKRRRRKAGFDGVKKDFVRVKEQTKGDIVFSRREREATSSYFDRMERETMSVLHKHQKQIQATGQKRKQYMKKKDAQRKSQRLKLTQEKMADFNQFQDHVQFGEVAQAPPILSATPRKAVTKQTSNSPSIVKERLRIIELYRRRKQTNCGLKISG